MVLGKALIDGIERLFERCAQYVEYLSNQAASVGSFRFTIVLSMVFAGDPS